MSTPNPSIAPAHTPAAGNYRIDPRRTEVRFTTRHLFGLGGVTGTVTLRDGEFTIAHPISESTVTAVLDSASFDSGRKARNKEVRSSHYLHTDKYPEILFTCTLIDHTEGKWVAVGVVTAHGVTQPVDLTVDAFTTEREGELALQATAKIDRYAHDITAVATR
jgi:polyisoprenoid-binding protein YceI